MPPGPSQGALFQVLPAASALLGTGSVATGHWKKRAKSVFDSLSYFLPAPLHSIFLSCVTVTPIALWISPSGPVLGYQVVEAEMDTLPRMT